MKSCCLLKKAIKTLLDDKKKINLTIDLITNYLSILILGISGIGINLFIGIKYDSEVLGSFNQVLASYIVFSMIGSGGINFSTLKFVAENNSKPQVINEIIMGAMIPTVILSFFCSLLYKLSIPFFSTILKSDLVAIGMRYIIPGLFFFCINKVLLSGFVNGQERMKYLAFYQSLRYIFLFSFLTFLISISINGALLPIIFSLTESLLFLILLIDLNNHASLLKAQKYFKWIKIHLQYGFKCIVSGIFIELNTKVDVLMIGFFLSDEFVGIYSFAALFSEGFYQIIIILQNFYNPLFARLVSNKKLRTLKKITNEGQKKIIPITFFLGIIIIIFFRWLINQNIFDDKYNESLLPFIILIFGILFSSGYIPFLNVLSMSNMPFWNSILIFFTVLINIIFNYLLIPIFGIKGAAMATSLSLIFSVYFLKFLCKRLIGIKL